MVNTKDVFEARNIIKKEIYRTPVITNEEINRKTGNDVFFKLENLQKTGAFKIRGVLNKIFHLSDEERNKGLICASSGNHGLGVSYVANKMRLKATIVIPEITPVEKVNKLKKFSNVLIFGKNYLESYNYALKEAKRNNLTFIHPFDDPFIIAGQGTISLEILEDIPDVDYIIVPIGGGGLASGILTTIKNLKADIKVIGVQSEGAPSMYKSWKKGKIVEIKEINTLAEGIAVGKPGELTFNIVKKFIDDIVLVNDDEILEGMKTLFKEVKIIGELAGVVSFSAIWNGKIKLKNKKICCIITGGNFSEKYFLKIIKGRI